MKYDENKFRLFKLKGATVSGCDGLLGASVPSHWRMHMCEGTLDFRVTLFSEELVLSLFLHMLQQCGFVDRVCVCLADLPSLHICVLRQILNLFYK